MVRERKPPDGNPHVSDGDLLSLDGFVCARNADLLAVFSTREVPLPDLGLDAVDILDADKYLVAFSTELDHPRGRFTAGDLLITNGAVIPNLALVFPFKLRYDIGLDEVKFIGKMDDILRFAEFARKTARATWLTQPGLLQQVLKRYNIDIWFSTEGTALTPNKTVIFLDGDLLSAGTGTVVVHQADLLPAAVPAGIPPRGVDFGVDAFAVPRDGSREHILFSTEIVFQSEKLNFTDGDVLRINDGVVMTNWDLIKAFEPRTRDLGLDALFLGAPGGCENKITNIGGFKVNEIDFGTDGLASLVGMNVPPDVPAQVTEHPHGTFVPFWGTICGDVKRFRVVYRKLSDGPPAGPNDGSGMPVTAVRGWKVYKPMFDSFCNILRQPWFSDAGGWYDAAEWRLINSTCDDVNLTVWYTQELGGGGSSADANDLYRVWLVYETTGGMIKREVKDHFVRLDNKYPQLVQMRLLTAGGQLPADTQCPHFGPADMPIILQAEIRDDYFWGAVVGVNGDALGGTSYTRQNYYNPPGAGEFPGTWDNPGGKGTTLPVGTIVSIRRVNVADIPGFDTIKDKACCYGTWIFASDRTIDGSFFPSMNLVGGGFRTASFREVYFSYGP